MRILVGSTFDLLYNLVNVGKSCFQAAWRTMGAAEPQIWTCTSSAQRKSLLAPEDDTKLRFVMQGSNCCWPVFTCYSVCVFLFVCSIGKIFPEPVGRFYWNSEMVIIEYTWFRYRWADKLQLLVCCKMLCERNTSNLFHWLIHFHSIKHSWNWSILKV